MREQDLEHRLFVLAAWNERHHKGPYVGRAIKDGCAITARALLESIGITAYFKGAKLMTPTWTDDSGLSIDARQKAALEPLLRLANRCVAHCNDNPPWHDAGDKEITAALNMVMSLLAQHPKTKTLMAKMPGKVPTTYA